MYIVFFVLAGGLIGLFWNKIKKAITGKDVAILGDVETGKTTLQNFLRYGKIPINRTKTANKDKLPGKFIDMGELHLNLKEGEDIGGDDIFFKSNWKELFSKADSCIYLINSFKVSKHDKEYLRRITLHLKHLNHWRTEQVKKNAKFKFICIGTYLDKLVNIDESNSNDLANKQIEIYTILKELFSEINFKPTEFRIGSLANEQYANELARYILFDLSNINHPFSKFILKYL